MAFCCSSMSASAVSTAGLAVSSRSVGSGSARSRVAVGLHSLPVRTTLAVPMRVGCMAPEEEKMTRRSPLDFPIVLGAGGYGNRILLAMFRDVAAMSTITRNGRDQSLVEDLIYFPNSVQ